MAAQGRSLKNKIISLNTDRDVQIACSDNLKFMRELPNESIKLIVTSPPYNIGKDYETKRPLDKYIEGQAATIAEAVRLSPGFCRGLSPKRSFRTKFVK